MLFLWLISRILSQNLRVQFYPEMLEHMKRVWTELIAQSLKCQRSKLEESRFRIQDLEIKKPLINTQNVNMDIKGGIFGNLISTVLDVSLEYYYVHNLIEINGKGQYKVDLDYLSFQVESSPVSGQLGARMKILSIKLGSVTSVYQQNLKDQIIMSGDKTLSKKLKIIIENNLNNGPFHLLSNLISIDPWYLSNLRFSTVQQIHENLIALHYDLNAVRPQTLPMVIDENQIAQVTIGFTALSTIVKQTKTIRALIDSLSDRFIEYFGDHKINLQVKDVTITFSRHPNNQRILVASFTLQVKTINRGVGYQGHLIFQITYSNTLSNRKFLFKAQNFQFKRIDFADNPVVVPDANPGQQIQSRVLSSQNLDVEWDCSMLQKQGCKRGRIQIHEEALTFKFTFDNNA